MAKDIIDPVVATALVPGQEYNVNTSGFTYIKGFALVQGNLNDKRIGAIIGTSEEFPIRELIQLKGTKLNLVYKGTKDINGTSYEQFSFRGISI